jgi:hypothetical protein
VSRRLEIRLDARQRSAQPDLRDVFHPLW